MKGNGKNLIHLQVILLCLSKRGEPRDLSIIWYFAYIQVFLIFWWKIKTHPPHVEVEREKRKKMRAKSQASKDESYFEISGVFSQITCIHWNKIVSSGQKSCVQIILLHTKITYCKNEKEIRKCIQHDRTPG